MCLLSRRAVTSNMTRAAVCLAVSLATALLDSGGVGAVAGQSWRERARDNEKEGREREQGCRS